MKVRSTLGAAILALAVAGAAGTAGRAQTTTAQTTAQTTTSTTAAPQIPGLRIPDGPMAREAARLVREREGELLFQHSMRVYAWAALAGQRKGLAFDPELLFVAAMFHDYGLTDAYGDSHRRFEVDSANAARDFLRRHGASEADSQKVWLAIALHTTNGISPHLEPTAALLAEAANMDLIAAGYDDFTPEQRRAVEAAFPRPPQFAEGFMQALYDGLKHRPEATQATGLADVMAYKDPAFRRRDFSSLMRTSRWATGQ